jgi:hypothetical protein
LTLSDFEYVGAFRLPADEFGSSSLNYSEGPLEYNPVNNSIFIVGHAHHQMLAEFTVPELVKSSEVTELNMAADPIQNFANPLDRVSSGNPQNINRIGGMEFIESGGGNELLVNGYEYYDAPGDNSHTTFVVRDPDDLAGSEVDGFFEFDGGAGHTTGWISPVPSSWQSLLGGTHITGHSSGIPIIGRSSVGPSAFVFDPTDIVGNSMVPHPIPTTRLLDFSLTNPLEDDLSNSDGSNDRWTHLSQAVYGFIPPGTRTYVTIGHSGGHGPDGVCYKCTPSNGSNCGGYCAVDSDDNYHYYWLWDMNELLRVMNGDLSSYDVEPYEYGKFPTPFPTWYLGGGTFDVNTGLLYLTSQGADRDQGTYSNPPIVVAYRFNEDPGSGSGGGSGGGGTGGEGDVDIGTLGKRTVVCLGGEPPMVRFDKNGLEGKELPVKRAIKAFRRALNRIGSAISQKGSTSRRKAKRRELRSSLKRAKQCKRGTLL